MTDMTQTSSDPKSSRWMLPNPLTRAWLSLLVLSTASALLTILPLSSPVLSAGILILALSKARIILARYLDLTHSPAWLSGFTNVLTGFAMVIFGLSLF